MNWLVAEAITPYDQHITDRTFNYALRAVRIHQHLYAGKSKTAKIIGDQFLRSATSVGANTEEAQCAESKADFVHKLRIAQKESRESHYWLRLLRATQLLDKERSEEIYKESDEILRILSKIIVNTRSNAKFKRKN